MIFIGLAVCTYKAKVLDQFVCCEFAAHFSHIHAYIMWIKDNEMRQSGTFKFHEKDLALISRNILNS